MLTLNTLELSVALVKSELDALMSSVVSMCRQRLAESCHQPTECSLLRFLCRNDTTADSCLGAQGSRRWYFICLSQLTLELSQSHQRASTKSCSNNRCVICVLLFCLQSFCLPCEHQGFYILTAPSVASLHGKRVPIRAGKVFAVCLQWVCSPAQPPR